MSYKDNYKSVQVNFKKDKHEHIIKWLEEKCSDSERSLNSLILQIIKEAYDNAKDEKV